MTPTLENTPFPEFRIYAWTHEMNEAVTNLKTLAERTASEITEIKKLRLEAREYLDSGYYGENGFNNRIQELEDKRNALVNTFEDKTSEIVEAVERAETHAFTVYASDLIDTGIEVINLVDLSQAECEAMALKYSNTNFSCYRAILTHAKRSGYSIIDIVKLHREKQNERFGGWVQWCRNCIEDSDYYDAIPQALEKFAIPLLEANKNFLNKAD